MVWATIFIQFTYKPVCHRSCLPREIIISCICVAFLFTSTASQLAFQLARFFIKLFGRETSQTPSLSWNDWITTFLQCSGWHWVYKSAQRLNSDLKLDCAAAWLAGRRGANFAACDVDSLVSRVTLAITLKASVLLHFGLTAQIVDCLSGFCERKPHWKTVTAVWISRGLALG